MSTLPFEPLDKVCLAGTRAPFASCAPSWRLTIRGKLERKWLEEAITTLFYRYPLIAARARAEGGDPERARRFFWHWDEKVDARGYLTRALREHDLTSATAAQLEALDHTLCDRVIDLFREDGLQLDWIHLPARDGEPRSTLHLQQHHSLADGRAFLGLIGDLIHALDRAARGLPPEKPEPMARRSEREVVPAWTRRWLRLLGTLRTLWMWFGSSWKKSAPLPSNLKMDPRGGDRTVHFSVPDSRQALWKRAKEKLNLSANDLLTGALLAAMERWSRKQGLQPGRTRLALVTEARPRGEAFESFANHLAWLKVECDLAREASPLVRAREAARQTREQLKKRVPLQRLFFEGPLALAVPMHWLRRAIFDKPQLFLNHTFSNLLPLGVPGSIDGVWRGQGFQVEAMRVTTPTLPPQGMSTTLTRHGSEVTFNFNYKESAVTRAEAEGLVACFAEALEELERGL